MDHGRIALTARTQQGRIEESCDGRDACMGTTTTEHPPGMSGDVAAARPHMPACHGAAADAWAATVPIAVAAGSDHCSTITAAAGCSSPHMNQSLGEPRAALLRGHPACLLIYLSHCRARSSIAWGKGATACTSTTRSRS